MAHSSRSIAGRTIADLLFRLRAAHRGRIAARSQVAPGEWADLTYEDLTDRATRIGLGLLDLGVARGDRVALLADTQPLWTTAHLGLTATGAVNVSVYPTSSPEECAHILADSGSVGIICEDAAQAAKIEAVRGELPDLRWVVVLEGSAAPDAITLADLEALGSTHDPGLLESRSATVTPDDAYVFMYTSGTTGPPRGCVLTHANYRFILDAEPQLADLAPDSVLYLFLPLAHAFALLFHLMVLDRGATLAYWGRDPQRLVAELAQTRPTHLPAVPRIFEKIYAAVVDTKDPESRQRLLAAARTGAQVRRLREAGTPVPADLLAAYDEAEVLLAEIRAVFGGRLERGISGGAPAAREILEFFYGAGVPITEGFGMTETSTAAAMNPPDAIRFGTVGVSLPGQEARIGQDGELLLRGQNILRCYWRLPEATSEAVDLEGWLHTGDLASIDEDGYITIVGRKKDIIVTAGGKNIAPANFENELKQHPLVSQVLMLGDRRPYPVALVTLDATTAAAWANQRGLPADPAALAVDESLRATLQDAIDQVNLRFARAEQVKRFAVLPRDLSQENGELTATQKVKRAVVVDSFSDLVESLYS